MMYIRRTLYYCISIALASSYVYGAEKELTPDLKVLTQDKKKISIPGIVIARLKTLEDLVSALPEGERVPLEYITKKTLVLIIDLIQGGSTLQETLSLLEKKEDKAAVLSDVIKALNFLNADDIYIQSVLSLLTELYSDASLTRTDYGLPPELQERIIAPTITLVQEFIKNEHIKRGHFVLHSMPIDYPHCCAFSLDDRMLACGTSSHSIIILELNENPIKVTTILSVEHQINSIAFDLSGNYLAAGLSNKTIIVIDIKEKKIIQTLPLTKPYMLFTLGPVNKELVCKDGVCSPWLAEHDAQLPTLHTPDRIRLIKFDPQGNVFLISRKDVDTKYVNRDTPLFTEKYFAGQGWDATFNHDTTLAAIVLYQELDVWSVEKDVNGFVVSTSIMKRFKAPQTTSVAFNPIYPLLAYSRQKTNGIDNTVYTHSDVYFISTTRFDNIGKYAYKTFADYLLFNNQGSVLASWSQKKHGNISLLTIYSDAFLNNLKELQYINIGYLSLLIKIYKRALAGKKTRLDKKETIQFYTLPTEIQNLMTQYMNVEPGEKKKAAITYESSI